MRVQTSRMALLQALPVGYVKHMWRVTVV